MERKGILRKAVTHTPKKMKGNGIYGDLQQVVYSVYRKEDERHREIKLKKKNRGPIRSGLRCQTSL